MSAEAIQGTIRRIGRAGAQVLFPNDIEYYAVTIELVNSRGDTVDHLTFPVNPDSFMLNDMSLVNIKKTLGGVTTLNSETFVPKPITMNGTFGRSFKLLLTPPLQDNPAGPSIGLNGQEGLSLKTNLLNVRLKSGYGAIKILESILNRSKGLDLYNKPLRLFLYLPLVGHNYLVEHKTFSLKQDFASSNMMWKYQVDLVAVAPLTNNRDRGGRLINVAKKVSIDILQKGIGSITQSIKNSIF